ncbi:Aldo/keto reductase [Hyaloraphidium curvatum]|nr:Aldo/keto reductase [Hyaloraphidium curvatum]
MSPPGWPPMIYGTAWKAERTHALVVQAVLAGFRRIDTACQPKHYREDLVGSAVEELARDHGVKREQLWIQTKFTPIDGHDRSKPLPYDPSKPVPEQVKQSVATSLKNLRTAYVDSLLLHSPLPMPDLSRAWRQLESHVKEGTVRQIGISNIYDPQLLRSLWEEAEVKPAVVQNRFYSATAWDKEVRAFCREKGMEYQSFWTLTANPHLLSHHTIRTIAKRLGAGPEQALYGFLIHGLGCSPLNGTSSREHAVEDLKVLHWTEKDVPRAEWDAIRRLIGDL